MPAGALQTPDHVISEQYIRTGQRTVVILNTASGMKYQTVAVKGSDGRYVELTYMLQGAGKATLIRARYIDASEGIQSCREYIEEL